MTEENKVRDAVDAATGLVKAVPIYQDLVQPAAQELGKGLQTLAKTVHIALAPVSVMVWGYDQIRDFVSTKVAERLKNVPEENIVTPKPNVAGPALEALRYTGHEEALSDLYANLLASAMDKATADGAHPAFVEIIKQMTPDEAKLIAMLAEPRAFPIISLRLQHRQGTGRRGGKDILTKYSHLGQMARCEYPDHTPAYLDNLCRLGLAEMPETYQYTASGAYDALKRDPLVVAAKAAIEQHKGTEGVVTRKGIRLTPLGLLFIQNCVKEKSR